MIVEWFFGLIAGLIDFIGTLLPEWEVPAALVDPDGMLMGLFAMGQGMAPFVDWQFVGLVGAIPLAVWVIGLLWKFARMAISHIPGFGGSG